MPIYDFEDAVKKVAEERGVDLYASHEDLILKIKKALENNTITLEEIAEKLKEHEDFRLKFIPDDFKKILDATK